MPNANNLKLNLKAFMLLVDRLLVRTTTQYKQGPKDINTSEGHV